MQTISQGLAATGRRTLYPVAGLKLVFLSFLFLSLSVVHPAYSQYIPEHIGNKEIYAFLDELAAEKIITLTDAVKPWSKAFIASRLTEANNNRDRLSRRCRNELDQYLRTYRPDLPSPVTLRWNERLNLFKKKEHLATSLNPFGLIYKDSLLTLFVKPIYGITYSNNENGSYTHTWGGLEAYGTMGRLGIYANLRDNHESEIMERPSYFTRETGGNYKVNEGGRGGGDYSEMRGGITYAWKWGNAGLVKDHFEWGTNRSGSVIFSGRTPSFAHLRLSLYPVKWLEFNYIHGWLVSEVIDSARSYYTNGGYRAVFRQKYLAANMLTLKPFRYLSLSFGNSIVYSDLGGVHAAYLIPLAFYKSIDHTVNNGIDNQNSQMFFDISSHNIRHLHLYASLFVDEFSITRISEPDKHNFLGRKAGFSLTNWPLKDLQLSMEYTLTNPVVYKHRIDAVTFASNRFCLGHYLGDNSSELSAGLVFRPVSRGSLEIRYSRARHGNEYPYLDGKQAVAYPVMQDISWEADIVDITGKYQFVPGGSVFVSYRLSDIRGYDLDGHSAQYYLDLYTPAFYQGTTHTLTLGFYLGL